MHSAPLPRRGRFLVVAAVAGVIGVLHRAASCGGQADVFVLGGRRWARRASAAARASAVGRRGEGSADSVWQEAYQLELERNALLREQLQSYDVDAPPEETEVGEVEACDVDWEGSYAKLQECNQALEARLRRRAPQSGPGRSQGAAAPARKREDLDAAGVPVKLTVQLAERQTVIQLFRRFDGGQFYILQAKLPLGLNITLREKGALRGSFVVENVLPGGSVQASGMVEPGHVLHAVTTIVSTMGVTTFDSGVTSLHQHLVDTSSLSSVAMLVEAIGTNSAAGPSADLVLIFERLPSGSPGEVSADVEVGHA